MNMRNNVFTYFLTSHACPNNGVDCRWKDPTSGPLGLDLCCFLEQSNFLTMLSRPRGILRRGGGDQSHSVSRREIEIFVSSSLLRTVIGDKRQMFQPWSTAYSSYLTNILQDNLCNQDLITRSLPAEKHEVNSTKLIIPQRREHKICVTFKARTRPFRTRKRIAFMIVNILGEFEIGRYERNGEQYMLHMGNQYITRVYLGKIMLYTVEFVQNRTEM